MFGWTAAVVLFLSQDIAWQKSWPEALKEAKASKKLAMLVFSNGGVRDCVFFEKETLTNVQVIAALRQYVCVRIDPEGSDADNKLWQDHKMPPLPTAYVFDPEGKMLMLISSISARGFAGALEAAGPAYFQKIQPAREALAKDPNQPEKLVLLGEAYAQLDSPTESAKAYEKAVDLLSRKGDKGGALKHIEAQISKFYTLKWYGHARRACQQLQELDPGDGTKLGAMGAWLVGMADCADYRWNDAITGMRAACEKYKDAKNLDQMMFTLGSSYMYAKDKDNAIAVFEQIIKQFPDSESARIAQVQVDKLKK